MEDKWEKRKKGQDGEGEAHAAKCLKAVTCSTYGIRPTGAPIRTSRKEQGQNKHPTDQRHGASTRRIID